MVKSQNSSRRVPEKSRLVLLLDNVYPYDGASQVVLVVKNPPANAGDIEMWVQSRGQEDLLEKKTATHSSILAWRIPWTEETGGLQSTGSQRVGHD